MDDREALERLNEAAVDAVRDGDLDAFMELWTDDAVVMRPHEPARVGKRAIREGQRDFFDQFTSEDQAWVDELSVEGDLAIERGSYEIRLYPVEGGEPIEDRGKYLMIHRRQPDGSWLFWRYVFNSDLPPST